jgi:anti-sigma-K factor RskA
VASTTSKIVSVAIALATLAWLLLVLGLVYARFFVTEPPPNVVITFSDKGLTRMFAELLSLGIGSLGLVLAVFALAGPRRDWRVALAALSNAAVCAVCVALLM